MILKTIGKTLRIARRLRRDELRGYVDEALGRYGYMRAPASVSSALPLVGAFSAGVAVGTGIGVLVAPRSGRETREMLIARVRDAIERMTRENGEGAVITDDPDITHGGPIGHS